LNRQQWIVAGSGILLLFSLYFLGRTKPLAKGTAVAEAPGQEHADHVQGVSIDDILRQAKQKLSPAQAARVTALENSLSRGDLVTQKINLYGQLAAYWKDSARVYEPHIWYLGEKAKLENSEKNLNFAAHSYLEELRGVSDPALKRWMAIQAKDLFTRSLELNPANDSAKVGLGSTYFFGAGGEASPMEGIMAIREVATRDSTNLFAQFMLGYGGMISGQLDKAAQRFEAVLRKDPENTEAVFLLAETYERLGEKKKALQWYEAGKSRVSNPEMLKALEDKMNSLK
jgi:tetratricopeptide (TPR) repeat protein